MMDPSRKQEDWIQDSRVISKSQTRCLIVGLHLSDDRSALNPTTTASPRHCRISDTMSEISGIQIFGMHLPWMTDFLKRGSGK